jgi:hypothetical protein
MGKKGGGGRGREEGEGRHLSPSPTVPRHISREKQISFFTMTSLLRLAFTCGAVFAAASAQLEDLALSSTGGPNGTHLAMVSQNSALSYTVGSGALLPLEPNIILAGSTVIGARVVNLNARLSSDRLGVFLFPGVPTPQENLTAVCGPSIAVIEFATMDQNGLILRGPAPPSAIQECMRRVYFTMIPDMDGPVLRTREILFEAWIDQDAQFSASGRRPVAVALPVAAAGSGGGCTGEHA